MNTPQIPALPGMTPLGIKPAPAQVVIAGRSEDGQIWAEVCDGEIIGWASHKQNATRLSEQVAQRLIKEYNDDEHEKRWVWKLGTVSV